MGHPIQLTSPADLYERDQALAWHRQQPVETVLIETVRGAFPQWPVHPHRAQMQREEAAFDAQCEVLLAAHRGHFVAVHDGKVVDWDRQELDLLRRVQARFEDQPVLIREVTSAPPPPLQVRSPPLQGAMSRPDQPSQPSTPRESGCSEPLVMEPRKEQPYPMCPPSVTDPPPPLLDPAADGDALVAALHAWSVPFLASETVTSPPAMAAAELLAALISHPEPRLRLAVIPLLLVQPGLATAIPDAARSLVPPVRFTLQCYYTAAHLLQQKYRPAFISLLGEQPALPDWFSAELGIPTSGEPDERLEQLGQRQAEGSGRLLNWTGGYAHAAERLLTRLTREAAWKELSR